MSGAKRSLWPLRLALMFVLMLAAYILSTMVIGEMGEAITQDETRGAGIAVVIVSLANALVLSFLILRSRWRGLKLVGVVVLVNFGVETFMAQIETLYFNSSVQMATADLVRIVGAGAIRAAVFAPLAVLIAGKMGKPAESQEEPASPPAFVGWKRFALLAVLYVFLYFLFGYFVAWQWEETRLYYSGTTAMKPFLVHFRDLFFRQDPFIIPFQLARGALWTGIATIAVRTIKAKRWQASAAVAGTFAVLLALPIGLFPNPYMPAAVRQSHFIELLSSMLLFGAVSGWVMFGRRAEGH